MPRSAREDGSSALDLFHAPVSQWFRTTVGEPTPAQAGAWPAIAAGRSTLLLAPTGSGKTLAAFLAAIDRLMFAPEPPAARRCRVLYISPLKALGADIERNLAAPLAGIAAAAAAAGATHRVPEIGVRSGDTRPAERARLARRPPDILITTPESLYLMLTSAARDSLAAVETIIVDEIHALVAGKRGAHLFVSLERLAAITGGPGQRIGLSATQRPLEEVARLLGGIESDGAPRPVEIVDAGGRKLWDLRVDTPVEARARQAVSEDRSEGADPAEPVAGLPRGASAKMSDGTGLAGRGGAPRGRTGGARREKVERSIWPAIYPRLVEHVRAHRSTMIFCNSRRLAERLAAAINDAAGEELALAHHGSVARERRRMIEERLKAGDLPAIVATSALELGIDVGAVDLVIQIEAPPSVAAGIQRIGRAGHQVGAVSRGILVPKFRGDLLACAAATPRMRAGEVEETLYPRCPLDVLAQQIVAAVTMDPWSVDELYALFRRAAPFAELSRGSFEGVLDMLSGRYPSDEFAELRPRITWDRVAGELRPREGARRLAVLSGGTIPDRGTYGVFLHGQEGSGRRVGELDEEMVYESRIGDVFVLGASSWRIAEITPDRVLVTPAPGQPGKTPFWHGDRPGRPVAFGRAIGELTRTLAASPRGKATERLRRDHGLDEGAADELHTYVREQAGATGEVPSDEVLVIERYLDDMGVYRVCLLSPFGARVHAPWALAIAARMRDEFDTEVETLWSDDGIVLRFPAADRPPDVGPLLLAADEIEDRVVRALGTTAVFAARFRENAARALLLPRRFPGKRSPLWAQRQKAADLLAVAARFGSFPILLETYRECLRDVFDLPGLTELLRRLGAGELRVHVVDTRTPSPFAASLLFSYVANFIYDGDAPLAERRAQALAVDTTQLRELLGEASLRELLDPAAIVAIEAQLQRIDGARPARSADALHDMLLALGDLTADEAAARCDPPEAARGLLAGLLAAGRVFTFSVHMADGSGAHIRHAAVEDAGRLRDALGIPLPPSIPAALAAAVADPLGDLVARYARTHAPFTVDALAGRFGLGVAPVRAVLQRLAAADRALAGEFTAGRRGEEWCDAGVLRALKGRSLARLRREVEPVGAAAFGRFLPHWQRVLRPRSGGDALLAAVAQLQGAPLLASSLDGEVLAARVAGYRPEHLDRLCASGEVRWAGLEAVGASDGRIALYLADAWPLLARPARAVDSPLVDRVRALLAARGALFFSDLAGETGAFPADVLAALWQLVWAGEVTNDTLVPLRKLVRGGVSDQRRRAPPQGLFRARRLGPPGSEGRWSLLPGVVALGATQAGPRDMSGGPAGAPSETARAAALAEALLERHGIVTREAVQAEDIAGGFSAVYAVLGAMEAAGKVRRGYFVAGLGAAQFAAPGADDRLRSLRDAGETSEVCVLASTDPANPYGAALTWPERAGARLARAAHTRVVLVDGALVALVAKDARSVITFLPEAEPERGDAAVQVARAVAGLASVGRNVVLGEIDGVAAQLSPLTSTFERAGFAMTSQGLFIRGSGEPADDDAS